MHCPALPRRAVAFEQCNSDFLAFLWPLFNKKGHSQIMCSQMREISLVLKGQENSELWGTGAHYLTSSLHDVPIFYGKN